MLLSQGQTGLISWRQPDGVCVQLRSCLFRKGSGATVETAFQLQFYGREGRQKRRHRGCAFQVRVRKTVLKGAWPGVGWGVN